MEYSTSKSEQVSCDISWRHVIKSWIEKTLSTTSKINQIIGLSTIFEIQSVNLANKILKTIAYYTVRDIKQYNGGGSARNRGKKRHSL